MRGVPYNGVADVTANSNIEWDNNKRVTFKSTLLALNTEIGQVVAIEHPDLPTYPGAHPASRAGSNGPFQPNTWPFRIEKWMLHADWSVEHPGALLRGLDVRHRSRPAAARRGPAADAGHVLPGSACSSGPRVRCRPAATDALFPSEYTFNLGQTFQYQGDGVLLDFAPWSAGLLPVNRVRAQLRARPT